MDCLTLRLATVDCRLTTVIDYLSDVTPLLMALFQMSRRRPPPRARRMPWASIGRPLGRRSRSSGRGAIASEIDASPGSEIEDSSAASRLGELSGYVLAAIAIGLPGTGAVVAAGPLAAELGEVAGHVAGQVAGDLKSTLVKAGLSESEAKRGARRLKAAALFFSASTRATGEPPSRGAFSRDAASAGLCTRSGKTDDNENEDEERKNEERKDLRKARNQDGSRGRNRSIYRRRVSGHRVGRERRRRAPQTGACGRVAVDSRKGVAGNVCASSSGSSARRSRSRCTTWARRWRAGRSSRRCRATIRD